jgi:Domain of unknown function (DUF4397)
MKPLRVGFVASSACVMLIIAGCGSKTSQSTTSTAGGQTSTAPSGEKAANEKAALVRFVDAVPGRNVSLAFGDTQLFSDVAYKTVTPYKEVAGERHDFKLTSNRERANGSPVTNSEGLTKGNRYTVVAALDKNGAEKLDVINDSLSTPADGKAKVRVINASETEVDVFAPVGKNGKPAEGTADRAKYPNRSDRYADENKWFGGVNQVSSTNFKDVEPYSGDLHIVNAKTQAKHHLGPAVQVPVDLKAGQLYTVVVTGGTRQYPLQAMTVQDQLNGPSDHARSDQARQ